MMNRPLINIQYEDLWIKVTLENFYLFLLIIYHPPKPIYPTSDLLLHLGYIIDRITTTFNNSLCVGWRLQSIAQGIHY